MQDIHVLVQKVFIKHPITCQPLSYMLGIWKMLTLF